MRWPLITLAGLGATTGSLDDGTKLRMVFILSKRQAMNVDERRVRWSNLPLFRQRFWNLESCL